MALVKRDTPARDVDERNQVRDRDGLLGQLNSTSGSERRWAARDLAECEGVSEALIRRLEVEAETSVRAALFGSLTKIGDTEAVKGLTDLLRSEDAELRNGSIEALRCLPDRLGAHIEALLADGDPDVRIFTVNILESLPHPNVPAWLWHVIEEEDQVNVCAAAMDVLAELATPEMIPAMQDLKERFADTQYIAFVVDLTVERIRSAQSVDARAQFPREGASP